MLANRWSTLLTRCPTLPSRCSTFPSRWSTLPSRWSTLPSRWSTPPTRPSSCPRPRATSSVPVEATISYLLPPAKPGGRPRTVDLREVVNLEPLPLRPALIPMRHTQQWQYTACRPYERFGYTESTDMAVRRTVSDAYRVCHGGRPPAQQAPRGCRVSCVELIVTGLNVDDYECPLVHRPNLRKDPFMVYGFSQGCYFPGFVSTACHGALLLTMVKRLGHYAKIRSKLPCGQWRVGEAV